MTFGHCEIFCFAESEMKFVSIRESEYFTFAELIFHGKVISFVCKDKFR